MSIKLFYIAPNETVTLRNKRRKPAKCKKNIVSDKMEARSNRNVQK